VRTRGVGHYTFSADNPSREKEMAALNAAREETEQQRLATQRAAQARRSKIEERRKEIAGRKRKREADKFLDGLALELEGST
jgi:coiled-coil domain-containing protein 174